MLWWGSQEDQSKEGSWSWSLSQVGWPTPTVRGGWNCPQRVPNLPSDAISRITCDVLLNSVNQKSPSVVECCTLKHQTILAQVVSWSEDSSGCVWPSHKAGEGSASSYASQLVKVRPKIPRSRPALPYVTSHPAEQLLNQQKKPRIIWLSFWLSVCEFSGTNWNLLLKDVCQKNKLIAHVRGALISLSKYWQSQ